MLDYNQNPKLNMIYFKTEIVRKPITGIVSGYHELPYVIIAPDSDNSKHTIKLNGKISVSPQFIITPNMGDESFDSVFDAETFDQELTGRLFSFAYGNKKHMKVKSDYFQMETLEIPAKDALEQAHDNLLGQEDIKTSLISCPNFSFYPVSLDKFISEIINREFNI